MRIGNLWRKVRRRVWIPVLLVIVAVLAAGTLTLRSKAEYTATATVLAKGGSNSVGSLGFSEVATSNTVADRALRDTGVPETVDELQAELSVVAGRSDIYAITIRDTDAGRAAKLANAIARDAASFYEELGSTTVSLASSLERQRTTLRAQYLAASKALLQFDNQSPGAASGQKPNPTIEAERLQLQLDQQAAAQAFLNLETGINQAELQQLINSGSFAARVVDEAVAVRESLTARLDKVAYAAGLALVIGIGLILLLDQLGPSIRKPEQVEEALGVSVVAVIPRRTKRTLKADSGN